MSRAVAVLAVAAALVAAAPAGAAPRWIAALRHRRRRGRPQRLRSARVFVNGRELRVARRRSRIDLRGLPRTVARVTIFVRTRAGRGYVRMRSYRTCVKK